MGSRKNKYRNVTQDAYQVADTETSIDTGSGGGGGGPETVPPPQPIYVPADNQTPVVNPGVNQTITLPTDSIQLDGSKSYDPENGAMSFQWTLENGPSMPPIANADKAIATVTGLNEGNYGFRLTITDGMGAVDAGLVYVTVLPAAGLTPTPTPMPPAENPESVNSPAPNAGSGTSSPAATTNTMTAPVLTAQPAPYQTSYSAPATPAAAMENSSKIDWLFWGIIAASIGFIVFAKND